MIPVAQMTKPIDVLDEFIEKGATVPQHIKQIRKEFGTRTITGAFHELK